MWEPSKCPVESRGPSLAETLRGPLSSVEQIVQLVWPHLELLELVDDDDTTAQMFALPRREQSPAEAAPPLPDEASERALRRERFLRRQLGFVQQAIVTHVWPDWSAELERTQPGSSHLVLGRFLVPPAPRPRRAPADPSREERAQEDTRRAVAGAAYASLLSLISRPSPATPVLPPASLELVVQSLEHLTHTYSVRELYLALGGASPAAQRDARADGMRLQRWAATVKLLFSVPAKVANAMGAAGRDVPRGLIWR